jgi:hypothetical protein
LRLDRVKTHGITRPLQSKTKCLKQVIKTFDLMPKRMPE